MPNAQVFSPSQTADYLFCPMYRWLKQEGWRERKVNARDIGAALGRSFATGIASYNVACRDHASIGSGTKVAEAVSAGLSELDTTIKEMVNTRNVGDQEAALTALPTRLERALSKSIEYDPIPPTWEKRDMEFVLPDSGNSRIDLGCWDGQTSVVVDYKLRLRLDSRYRMAEVKRLQRNWQMLHYTFFYGQYLKKPVDRYIVLLTVLEPKFEILPIDLTTVWVTEEELAQWHAFAKQVWADMAAEDSGERLTRGKTECENRFGPCEFVDACWNWHYDESLMNSKYVKYAG